MTNNDTLRRVRYVFDYHDFRMLGVFALADVHISKHELSASFRKAGHKNYRECKDQILRNFLAGLQLKYRPVVA